MKRLNVNARSLCWMCLLVLFSTLIPSSASAFFIAPTYTPFKEITARTNYESESKPSFLKNIPLVESVELDWVSFLVPANGSKNKYSPDLVSEDNTSIFRDCMDTIVLCDHLIFEYNLTEADGQLIENPARKNTTLNITRSNISRKEKIEESEIVVEALHIKTLEGYALTRDLVEGGSAKTYLLFADWQVVALTIRDSADTIGDAHTAFLNRVAETIEIKGFYPEDTTWYDEGIYSVGEGQALVPGEYFMLCPTFSEGTVQISADGSFSEAATIGAGTFYYSDYVTVYEGEFLSVTGAKFCAAENAPNARVHNGRQRYTGTYKVGKDVHLDFYYMKSHDGGRAIVQIKKDSRHTADSIVREHTVNMHGGPDYTYLEDAEDGYYVSIVNGTVTYADMRRTEPIYFCGTGRQSKNMIGRTPFFSRQTLILSGISLACILAILYLVKRT